MAIREKRKAQGSSKLAQTRLGHEATARVDDHAFCTARIVAVFACFAGLTSSSSFVVMKGISGLFDGLGLASWTSDLLAGALGFVGACTIFIYATRRRFAGGLSPSEALAQLQNEIDLATAVSAERRSPSPGATTRAEAFP